MIVFLFLIVYHLCNSSESTECEMNYFYAGCDKWNCMMKLSTRRCPKFLMTVWKFKYVNNGWMNIVKLEIVDKQS